MICRADTGCLLDYNDCSSGANDTYTADSNKHYCAVGMFRKSSWILPNAFDTWRDFNFATDHEIPAGEYELYDGVYGDEKH